MSDTESTLLSLLKRGAKIVEIYILFYLLHKFFMLLWHYFTLFGAILVFTKFIKYLDLHCGNIYTYSSRS